MPELNRDSILISTKKMLGVDPSYDAFDLDIITDINSVFMILNQLGVGPDNAFTITGEEETWSDFYSENGSMPLVQSYVYLKVRLMFDPPTTGVLHEAMERQIKEYEWRLNLQAEVGVNK